MRTQKLMNAKEKKGVGTARPMGYSDLIKIIFQHNRCKNTGPRKSIYVHQKSIMTDYWVFLHVLIKADLINLMAA